MRSIHRTDPGQLRLVTPDAAAPVAPAARAPASRPRPRRGGGRNLRMAERLDGVAAQAERDAMDAVIAGADALARDALERAAAARKAARILRAGPGGVRDLLAS
jgi:hypothetical protein